MCRRRWPWRIAPDVRSAFWPTAFTTSSTTDTEINCSRPRIYFPTFISSLVRTDPNCEREVSGNSLNTKANSKIKNSQTIYTVLYCDCNKNKLVNARTHVVCLLSKRTNRRTNIGTDRQTHSPL